MVSLSPLTFCPPPWESHAPDSNSSSGLSPEWRTHGDEPRPSYPRQSPAKSQPTSSPHVAWVNHWAVWAKSINTGQIHITNFIEKRTNPISSSFYPTSNIITFQSLCYARDTQLESWGKFFKSSLLLRFED